MRGAVVILCCLWLAGCGARALPGRAAPPFAVTLANRQRVTLESFRGRVLLINFWASWCPPCVEETPALNALAQEFPQGKVVVLGVSIDQDPVSYQTFLTRFQIHFLTARDPSADIMHRYGTVQIPETYIIDPRGQVRRKLVSAAAWTAPAMVRYLRQLANGG